MAQHDYTIANQGFPAFRSDLNDALAAIVSNNSGATEPTTMFAHQMWVDTAANPSILKIRNADNDAWITIGSIDQTGDTFTLVNLRTSGPVVFNDAGADVDFRVEGDTEPNLLFVDASADAVGIGTNTPAANGLEISKATGSATPTPVELRLATTTSAGDWSTTDPWGRLSFYSDDATGAGPKIHGTIQMVADAANGGASRMEFYMDDEAGSLEKMMEFDRDNEIAFFTNASTERLRIDSSGNVGIGTSSPTSLGSNVTTLDIVGTNGGGIRFERTSATASSGYLIGSNGAVILSAIDAVPLVFRTTNTERMRISSAGEVLVGGTTEIAGVSGLSVQYTNSNPSINLFRNDTIVSSGNSLGEIAFYGNDTTSNTPTKLAYVNASASATHSAGSNGTDLVFGVTASGTDTVFEALRITRSGTLESQDTYDNTQTGSTVVVTSAGLIGRTSSSIKYKKDVETLNAELVDNAITNLRPVWYRTKDAKGDDKETWSHIGLIAEEVHEVEPRLVRYRTEKVEFVDVEEQVTKTREVSPAVTDEEGNVVQEAVTEEYTETVTRKEKQKTPLETPEPEDVDYGRLAVLCLAKIQQQEQTIAALEARIAALEA